MLMFDVNWPIQIKHVHSTVSYQRAIYLKCNRDGLELPIEYGSLGIFRDR